MDHLLDLEPVATHAGAAPCADCGVVELTAAELDAVGGGGGGGGGTGTGPAGRSSQFASDAYLAGGGSSGTGAGIA